MKNSGIFTTRDASPARALPMSIKRKPGRPPGALNKKTIARIEQGVELLTGTPAGIRNGSGRFEDHTVFARVDERLREMARVMKDYQ